jgi:DNA replication protein DnaC
MLTSSIKSSFPMLTASLIDRLTHHAHILNMNGTSFRLKQRLQKSPNGDP